MAEQLAGFPRPRQVARAFAALGIASITAHSPQAKGRIERLFNTLQDRLVVELRLAGAGTTAAATAVLAAYLPRFNAAFAVPAVQPGRAYRPLPADLDVRQVCCLKEARVVANDDTIQIDGQRLQVLPGRERRTYVRATIEVRQHVDGTRSLWHGAQELAWQPAPADARALRNHAGVGAVGGRARPPHRPHPACNLEAEDRAELAPPPPPPGTPKPRKPRADHIWRAGFAARNGDKFTDAGG